MAQGWPAVATVAPDPVGSEATPPVPWHAMTLALSQSVGLDSGLDVDITPVAGALGAEVRGLDPQAPGDAPTWDRCRSDKTAASGYYGLAVFEF